MKKHYGLTAVAWMGATGPTTWHLLKTDGARTLCGLAVPKKHHICRSGTVNHICQNCAREFLEPLI